LKRIDATTRQKVIELHKSERRFISTKDNLSFFFMTILKNIWLLKLSMKVAVIGSWPEKSKYEFRDKEHFPVACDQLGREIMRTGHSLIVSWDAAYTADYSVVNGFIKELGDFKVSYPRIYVFRRAGMRAGFEKPSKKTQSFLILSTHRSRTGFPTF
jgi:hypothetical protein